jgi:hypothetical protein
MDGMDFVRKVSTTAAKGKKELVLAPPLRKRERDRVVRYSTPEVKAVKEVFLAQLILRCAVWPLGLLQMQMPIALFLLNLHCRRFVAGICNCCAMKSDNFGLQRPGHHNLSTVDTERETRGLSGSGPNQHESPTP